MKPGLSFHTLIYGALSLWISQAAFAQPLELVDVLRQLNALDGVTAASWSPDGNHLYVASREDSALSVLTVDSEGNLSFEQLNHDDLEGIVGLGGAADVAVSPDGEHVYAVGTDDNALAVFARDPTTGRLTFIEALFENVNGVSGLLRPTSVTVSPDGAQVYATAAGDQASASGSSLAAFTRNPSTGELMFLDVEFDRQNGVNGLFRAESAAVSPDGGSVYVAAPSDNAVAVFERALQSGELTYIEHWEDSLFGGANDIDELSGAVDVIVSSDSRHVYVAARSDDNIVIFQRDTATGSLTLQEVVENGVNGVTGLDGVNAISADGSHYYTAAIGSDAVAAFSRNASSGSLEQVSVLQNDVGDVIGLNRIGAIAANPDGNVVVAPNDTEDLLAIFERNQTTDDLAFLGIREDELADVVGLDQVRHVVSEPGGHAFYTAGFGEDAIGVFQASPLDGVLNFVEFQQQGRNGVNGLNGVTHLTVSGDRQHVYAAGSESDAVAVFRITGENGELTFVEAQRGGSDSVDALASPMGTALSPHGEHLYVANQGSGVIAVFGRDELTGELTPLGQLSNVLGLSSATSIAISPDGLTVYSVSLVGSTLVALDRDPITGLLTDPNATTSASTVAYVKGGGSSEVNRVYTGAFERRPDDFTQLRVHVFASPIRSEIWWDNGTNLPQTVPGAVLFVNADGSMVVADGDELVLYRYDILSERFVGTTISSEGQLSTQTTSGASAIIPDSAMVAASDNRVSLLALNPAQQEPFGEAGVWSSLDTKPGANGGAIQRIAVAELSSPAQSINVRLTLPFLDDITFDEVTWECTAAQPGGLTTSCGTGNGRLLDEAFTLDPLQVRSYIVNYPPASKFKYPFKSDARITPTPDKNPDNNRSVIGIFDGDKIFLNGFELIRND